jgi:ABC-type oligopeptide transport system ATPase subunit
MTLINRQADKTVIRLRELKRFYKVGVEEIHALDGVDLEVCEKHVDECPGLLR